MGDWAFGEALVDGADDLLHHRGFIDAAARMYGTEVVVPEQVYVNLTTPVPRSGSSTTAIPQFKRAVSPNTPPRLPSVTIPDRHVPRPTSHDRPEYALARSASVKSGWTYDDRRTWGAGYRPAPNLWRSIVARWGRCRRPGHPQHVADGGGTPSAREHSRKLMLDFR